MGTLRIEGKMKLKQFWPTGKSDADTTKILLNVQGNSFSFKPDGSSHFSSTNAFVDAFAKGDGQRPTPVIKKKAGTVTIRLQGIDAPELHYKIYGRYPKCTATEAANLKKENKEYRQYLGETATVKLSEFLAKAETNGEVDGLFESSNLKKPSDAIDLYGRLIGDILIDVNGVRTNVNRWLLEEGWVFPAFYDSLQQPEIDDYLVSWKQGRTIQGRVWEYYSPYVKTFNYNLLYRQGGKPQADKGKVIMPKMFRRFCVYSICSKAGLCKGIYQSFKAYLGSQKNDKVILLTEFAEYLQAGKSESFLKPLSQYFTGGKFSKSPDQLVFTEKDSVLIDSHGNEITSWG